MPVVSSQIALLRKLYRYTPLGMVSHVNFGLLLSGEKLVDNLALRDHLHNLEPEAIGGEMEGMGLYAAAQRYKTDWILVKAICDWGDGKKARAKSQRQSQAARNAALFIVHVLQKTRLID